MVETRGPRININEFQSATSLADSLQADLTSVGYKYTSAGQLLLESKHYLRKRGVPSPDEADAVCLTYAEPSGFRVNKNFNKDLLELYAKQGLYA